MSWKKLPYWLKGGIIAQSITLLLHIIQGEFKLLAHWLPLMIFGIDKVLTGSWGNFHVASKWTILSLFMNIIFFFILGAIAGLIIQKIKSRK